MCAGEREGAFGGGKGGKVKQTLEGVSGGGGGNVSIVGSAVV